MLTYEIQSYLQDCYRERYGVLILWYWSPRAQQSFPQTSLGVQAYAEAEFWPEHFASQTDAASRDVEEVRGIPSGETRMRA